MSQEAQDYFKRFFERGEALKQKFAGASYTGEIDFYDNPEQNQIWFENAEERFTTNWHEVSDYLKTCGHGDSKWKDMLAVREALRNAKALYKTPQI